jgi:hypothetical protein
MGKTIMGVAAVSLDWFIADDRVPPRASLSDSKGHATARDVVERDDLLGQGKRVPEAGGGRRACQAGSVRSPRPRP